MCGEFSLAEVMFIEGNRRELSHPPTWNLTGGPVEGTLWLGSTLERGQTYPLLIPTPTRLLFSSF